MLADANEIRILASSGGKELSGVLRLGLPPTIGPYLLPRIIPELHATYPELKLYIREVLPRELPAELAEGRHDVILTLLPVRSTEFVVEPVFREPLYLTVAADHRIAGIPRPKRTDLEGTDMLALGPGHQLHDVALALCEEFGANIRLDYEGTSLDTLREMVAMDLGVTFLPGLYIQAVASRDASVHICELEGRSIYRTVGLAWRQTSARQQSYRTLATMLRTVIERDFQDISILT
jgi:LysR family hydrogen peroxide-inducible transcriptional activator